MQLPAAGDRSTCQAPAERTDPHPFLLSKNPFPRRKLRPCYPTEALPSQPPLWYKSLARAMKVERIDFDPGTGRYRYYVFRSPKPENLRTSPSPCRSSATTNVPSPTCARTRRQIWWSSGSFSASPGRTATPSSAPPPTWSSTPPAASSASTSNRSLGVLRPSGTHVWRAPKYTGRGHQPRRAGDSKLPFRFSPPAVSSPPLAAPASGRPRRPSGSPPCLPAAWCHPGD
jgi:hypothetical protein